MIRKRMSHKICLRGVLVEKEHFLSALHIQAMLSKIVFQSDDSSFVVAEFIDAQSAKRFRATGKYLTIGKII